MKKYLALLIIPLLFLSGCKKELSYECLKQAQKLCIGDQNIQVNSSFGDCSFKCSDFKK